MKQWIILYATFLRSGYEAADIAGRACPCRRDGLSVCQEGFGMKWAGEA
jgi:hypothetical protein